MLKHYKDQATVSSRRARFSRDVICTLVHFINGHDDCIANAAGGITADGFVPVPSTTGRTGRHPLAVAADMVPMFASKIIEPLTLGPKPPKWNEASDEGFVVNANVKGRALVVIDDTFTTGARSQSAASALSLAGATVTAIVPVGRIINPTYDTPNADYWKAQTGGENPPTFDFDRCALCVDDEDDDWEPF